MTLENLKAYDIIDAYAFSGRTAYERKTFGLFLSAIEDTPPKLQYPIRELFVRHVKAEIEKIKPFFPDNSDEDLLNMYIRSQSRP